MPRKASLQSQCAIARRPVCAGEFFQQFRGLSTGEFVRAPAKDFAQIPLCDYRIVLLFRRSLRQFLAPGFRNVLRSPAVALPFADWLSGPVKLRRFRLSGVQSIRSFRSHVRDLNVRQSICEFPDWAGGADRGGNRVEPSPKTDQKQCYFEFPAYKKRVFVTKKMAMKRKVKWGETNAILSEMRACNK